MNVTEAIVLAGGLGTRLRDAVPGIPKCMAPVQGKPFIHWVIQYLKNNRVNHFVFALGYQSNMMIEYLNTHPLQSHFSYSIENEPLGTGGAIQLALSHCIQQNVLVLNGDTLYKADVEKLALTHHSTEVLCSMVLKPMQDCSRYGTVIIDDQNQITGFAEKMTTGAGLINGGMYLLKREAFLALNLPAQFSFEKDFLQPNTNSKNIYATIDDGYFIDIGIPEDYLRANQELTSE